VAAATSHHGLSRLGDGVNARLHSHLGDGVNARLHSHLGDGENARLHSHLGDGENARLDENECMDECMDEYMDELSAPQRQQLWLAKLVKAYEAADLHVDDDEDDEDKEDKEDDEDKEEVKSDDRRVRISASRTKRLTRRRRSSFSRVQQWLRVTRRPLEVQL
jgi:TATA-binding protein-associated factor Taf7